MLPAQVSSPTPCFEDRRNAGRTGPATKTLKFVHYTGVYAGRSLYYLVLIVYQVYANFEIGVFAVMLCGRLGGGNPRI